jgi:hypothetical protein
VKEKTVSRACELGLAAGPHVQGNQFPCTWGPVSPHGALCPPTSSPPKPPLRGTEIMTRQRAFGNEEGEATKRGVSVGIKVIYHVVGVLLEIVLFLVL